MGKMVIIDIADDAKVQAPAAELFQRLTDAVPQHEVLGTPFKLGGPVAGEESIAECHPIFFCHHVQHIAEQMTVEIIRTG